LLLLVISIFNLGFSLLEICDKDFYSLLDMYMFLNGASDKGMTPTVVAAIAYHYVLTQLLPSNGE
jgi:hypothetical protein